MYLEAVPLEIDPLEGIPLEGILLEGIPLEGVLLENIPHTIGGYPTSHRSLCHWKLASRQTFGSPA